MDTKQEGQKEFLQEKELSGPRKLCNDDGTLNKNNIGWSRDTIFDCNLKGRPLRKKKWNYWCVINEECLFSVTISNIDYAGVVFAYFLDFKTKKYIEKTIMTPFGKGCSMPSKVHETVSFKDKDMIMNFIAEGNDTHIITKTNNFNGEKLDADFTVLFDEGQETLNVVIPWNEKVFQFTSKQEALPVLGSLRVGDKTYNFEKNTSFACLDYGRGIWPYKVSWNWANASGIVNDHLIGFNLGARWTDGTGMTENSIIVDGKLIKLSEDVIYNYDPNDYMKPWTIKTAISDRVNIKFDPIYERIAKTDFVILKSKIHQMVGSFSGEIKGHDGEVIQFQGLRGCAEDHYGQW